MWTWLLTAQSYSSRPFGVKFLQVSCDRPEQIGYITLNILVSLIFTKPETRFKHRLSLKNYFYCKNEIFFIHVPRTFLLENGRGGKALGTRLNPDPVWIVLFFFPIYNVLQTIIRKLTFKTHGLTFIYNTLKVELIRARYTAVKKIEINKLSLQGQINWKRTSENIAG